MLMVSNKQHSISGWVNLVNSWESSWVWFASFDMDQREASKKLQYDKEGEVLLRRSREEIKYNKWWAGLCTRGEPVTRDPWFWPFRGCRVDTRDPTRDTERRVSTQPAPVKKMICRVGWHGSSNYPYFWDMATSQYQLWWMNIEIGMFFGYI